MRWRPEDEPKRWTEGGAQDALSRRAASLFKLPAPSPLGSLRREQIARRLAVSAAHSHPGLPLFAKATGIVAVTGAIAIGVVRSASTPERPLPTKTTIVAPTPVAPAAAVPDLVPVPAETARPSAMRASSGRSDGARGVIQIAGRAPAHPARASLSAPDVESLPPNRFVSPAPVPPLPAQQPLPPPSPAIRPAPQPPSAYPTPVPQSESYAAPSVTYRDETLAPPFRRSEPRLLAEALASLHADGDAEGALALLAEHRKRFPNGALRSEARVAEVEALLSLERRSEALRVLDGLDIERLPRGSELGVLRGELRAQAGRCADAIADFNRCAAGPSCSPQSEERALFGRASCRGKLDQAAAARSDLEHYLFRFPHGWRSEAVRRALAEKH